MRVKICDEGSRMEANRNTHRRAYRRRVASCSHRRRLSEGRERV